MKKIKNCLIITLAITTCINAMQLTHDTTINHSKKSIALFDQYHTGSLDNQQNSIIEYYEKDFPYIKIIPPFSIQNKGADFDIPEVLSKSQKQPKTTKPGTVFFFTDDTEPSFVLKNPFFTYTDSIIAEAFGSQIGLSIGMNIHKTKILPKSKKFIHKKQNFAAILTTFMQGNILTKNNNPFPSTIDINDGLSTEASLKSITYHHDLCNIVALDIFVNNPDRKEDNYLYDEEKKCFNAIDLGESYIQIAYYNEKTSMSDNIITAILQEPVIACKSYHFLKQLNPDDLNKETIDALSRVNTTLQKLVSMYSVSDLYAFWMKKVEECEYEYSEGKKKFMQIYIHYNMYWVHKVVEQLNRIAPTPEFIIEQEKQKEEKNLEEKKQVPKLTKNYIQKDTQDFISDLATMNPALAYTVATSIPTTLKEVISKSNLNDNFKTFLSHRYTDYFTLPEVIPQVNLPAIDLNYMKPFTINEIRKPYGTTEIIFLKDAKNDEFVLKFYTDRKQEECIPEYLGSYIGLSVGILINKVEIVLPNTTIIPHKIITRDQLSTLHTLVPGSMVKELPNLAEVNIQYGLSSMQNLNSITLHTDLCDIVAFDIALNNKDRGQNNYFFDATTNHYHAIDTGAIFTGITDNKSYLSNEQEIKRFFPKYIFHKTVSYMSYVFLKKLKVHKLSPQQIEALKRVHITLKKIIDQFSADTLYNFWMDKAQEVNLSYPKNKKAVLKLYIDYNDYYVKKVITELDRIISTPPITREEQQLKDEKRKKKEVEKQKEQDEKKRKELEEEVAEAQKKEAAAAAATRRLNLQRISRIVPQQEKVSSDIPIAPLPLVPVTQPLTPEIESPSHITGNQAAIENISSPARIATPPAPVNPITPPISKTPQKKQTDVISQEDKPEKPFYEKFIQNTVEYIQSTLSLITSTLTDLLTWLAGR